MPACCRAIPFAAKCGVHLAIADRDRTGRDVSVLLRVRLSHGSHHPDEARRRADLRPAAGRLQRKGRPHPASPGWKISIGFPDGSSINAC